MEWAGRLRAHWWKPAKHTDRLVAAAGRQPTGQQWGYSADPKPTPGEYSARIPDTDSDTFLYWRSHDH